jgi:hypothetical protein
VKKGTGMPRLYELAKGEHQALITDSVGEVITVSGIPDNLQAFDCSDVASFICDTLPEWDYSKLCLAPPYPDMFVEYEVPSVMGSPRTRIGARVTTVAREHALFESNDVAELLRDKGVRWVFKAFYFACSHVEAIGDLVGAGYCLQTGLDIHGLPLPGLTSIFRQNTNGWVQEPDDENRKRCLGELFPALFSISYISDRCNLQPVRPSRQQKRHAARTGRPEPYTYHVLKVAAFQQFRQRQRAASGSASSPRLHDVRAHWAHYTPEKPLFGRVVCTVWRSSHLRGDPERGVIEKSYEVVRPKKKTA